MFILTQWHRKGGGALGGGGGASLNFGARSKKVTRHTNTLKQKKITYMTLESRPHISSLTQTHTHTRTHTHRVTVHVSFTLALLAVGWYLPLFSRKQNAGG